MQGPLFNTIIFFIVKVWKEKSEEKKIGKKKGEKEGIIHHYTNFKHYFLKCAGVQIMNR